MKRFSLAALTALITLGTPTLAHEYKVGDIVVDHPMAFETPKTAKAGGGYLTITNTGDTADRLLEVRASFPRVMLHTTEEQDGIAKMKHVDGIDIPAGATVALEPGGYHVMFMGLNGDPFEVGEKILATLVFEKAGRVEVLFHVEERKADGHGSHGDHSGHGSSD